MQASGPEKWCGTACFGARWHFALVLAPGCGPWRYIFNRTKVLAAQNVALRSQLGKLRPYVIDDKQPIGYD
jgi:hypothetical protein